MLEKYECVPVPLTGVYFWTIVGYRIMKKLILTCCIALFLTPPIRSQDEDAARKFFDDAVAAMGGSTFLNVTDMVSEGNYFMFNRSGESSPLIKFTDYTKFPDKSRFRLGDKKHLIELEVFNLETNEGWIQEGDLEPKAATPDDMRDFKNAVKHSLEMIFRSRYKDPNNKLFYLGPGDGRDITLEKVKLIDPENDEVTVYFNRLTKLPAKLEYVRVDQNGVRQHEVREFSQWHRIQDVNTSLRTDGYTNGRQSFQIHTVKIKFDNDLPDSLFSKPVPED